MIDTKYCKIESREVFEIAVGLARGPYQSNLILGVEPWYGKPKQRYDRTPRGRTLLLARLDAAGLKCIWNSNKRLVIE